MTVNPNGSMQEPAATNLLWTGGWDSTFRVCMLVFVHARPVQPYYLFVSTRESAGLELATIQQLKQIIREKNPQAGALIRPTVIVERDELPRDEVRWSQLERLRVQGHLGDQYEGLARLCDRLGVNDMELCVHRDDRAHRYIESISTVEHGDSGPRHRVDPALMDAGSTALFEHFRFPLLDLDKRQMHAIAQEHDFDDVLEHTWFCHRPRNGKPCGTCYPCRYTFEEGLAWRMPRTSRLRANAHAAVLRMKSLALKSGPVGRVLVERLGGRATD